MQQQLSFSIFSRQYTFTLKSRGPIYHMYAEGQYILSFDCRESVTVKTLLPKLEAAVDMLERAWGFLNSDLALQQAAQVLSYAARFGKREA